MNQRTKKLATLAMLSALAYIAVFFTRIPIVSFLDYEAKDVIITIGGFLFGPLSAFIISLVVSLVEMFTISDTGFYGMIMNVIATCAFSCTAAFIYKKMRSLSGAVIGLLVGVVSMTVTMLLWNYIITPLYLGMPRQSVVEMLIPIILPFNLLKAGLNAALTMLLYRPVSIGLRKSRLLPESKNPQAGGGKITIGVMLASALVLATLILLVLIFMGKI